MNVGVETLSARSQRLQHGQRHPDGRANHQYKP